MKTIVEALKDLYVALGGKEQDVANLLLNPDVIEKIAAVAGDAVKPELPSLTGNAGKFLKVDSDAEGVEWGEAGGGGAFIIELYIGADYETGLICNHTFSEVLQAINNKTPIIPVVYAVGFDDHDNVDYNQIVEVYTPLIQGTDIAGIYDAETVNFVFSLVIDSTYGVSARCISYNEQGLSITEMKYPASS